MKKNISFSEEYAVSEIVGGLLLILIALMVFSVIYLYVFPLPIPPPEPNVDLMGYVTDDGIAVIAHMGGEVLSAYKIDVRYTNGTLINSTVYKNKEDTRRIGECIYPLTNIDMTLRTEEDRVWVTVYSIHDDSSEEAIFDGILIGKGNVVQPAVFELPMLFSSLMTNTTDEDLICHNHGINPQIDALTYIYNWSVNGITIANLLMPFDTNNPNTAKDYSGNGKDGDVTGPTWDSDGVVGGAYQFNGVDDCISLPYCFDGDSFIDEVTVEAWINTTSDSVAIASFDRNIFWDLGIANGVARWSTNANDSTTYTIGATNLIDGNWHYVAATYDSSSGECSIYVDGELDKNENGHNPGEELGIGSDSDGFIGRSIEGVIPETWDVLTYDDFESGWGNYIDGGRDCYLYNGDTYAHQGNRAAGIQDNSGPSSSFSYINGVDVDSPGYISIKVDFWFIAHSMEYNEDFWVIYYDGNQWHTVADYDSGDEFVNDQFYHEIVWINETDYTFPPNMKIRFQCDASHDQDDVYIDQIYVNATVGGTEVGNFSGVIDEFRIYNRALSPEQIYQNFLCMKNGFSDISVIVSEETNLGETWICEVTPNDNAQDDDAVISNSLQIEGYGGGE